jgi:hypothetical protein
MKSLKNFLMMGLILAPSLFVGCKKDKADSPDNDDNRIKTAKFTFTVNGATSGSVVSISAAGNNTAGELGVWKVNGQERPSETAIVLNADDFTGSTKTYVLEITKPVFRIGINLAGDITDNGTPYKISYKAEINNKEVNNEQNVTVDQAHDYFHNYTYDK